ncbi:MAG: hypothetical protein FWC39_00190 [Bacteroidetes bacterium]|nr:hypothetical protein [Bacteroidota bacterium]
MSDLKQRYYNKPDYCGFGYYWSLELLKNNKFIIQLSEKDKIGWTREKMLEVKHQLDIRNVQESGFTTTFF